jgi:alpha-D-xyloside xylohydrolase
MKKILLLFYLIWQVSYIKAQVTSYQQDSNGIIFLLQTGIMKVQVCRDNIIHVSYCNDATMPVKQSIIVNKIWDTPSYTVAANDLAIVIETEKLRLSVSKGTAQINYYSKDGSLLLAEDSKQVIPVTVLGVSTKTCIATFKSPADEAIFGLGQHMQSVMNFKGKNQVLDQQNTEIALPFMISNKGYGLLWDNYSLTNFYGNESAGTKYKFSSESGCMVDYYFMYGPEADTIISAYRIASGVAPMFPKWAYGLFQSKDKYESSSDLLKIMNKYRSARIPLDCIVQDWDYWSPDPWGSHVMNASRYPDPKGLIDSLHKSNIHTMISIWPVFKQGDANYNEFSAIKALYPSGGPHHFYDPHKAEARDIYWRQVKEDLFAKYGWDAWWADNDEPQGYPDAFDRKAYTTAMGPGVTYYNTYPIMHTSSVYDGWIKDIPNKRLFTLSRSAFSGQQRYATACWSGDIQSNWDDFKKQLSAGLNFSLSGIPYWTTDIGGYWSTDWTQKSNRELFIRWFEYGTFCPIYRVHGKGDRALFSTSSWDDNTRCILLNYDKLRYRLMPYIYSLAWKVTSENYTIMRHLIMDYRKDTKVYNIGNQFMFGPFMMINPVATQGTTSRSVYLPAGVWYDFWTGVQTKGGQTITTQTPLDKLPIFVKAGSIIPMGPEIEYATQSIDPLEIRVFKGADGNFSLYEDEGDTYNYEKGKYSVIPFTYNEASKELTIGDRIGSFSNMLAERTLKIAWVDTAYGAGINIPIAFDTIVKYNGNQVTVQYDPNWKAPKTHYEAEYATLTGTAKVAKSQTGYSGAGFVSGLNTSGSADVTFAVIVQKADNYIVKLRHSAGLSNAKRTLSLYVNDSKITDLTCNATADWNTWGETSYLVSLNSGSNTISYKADSTSVALDCIDITPSTSLPSNIAQRLIGRIRPQNSNLYLDAKNGGLALAAKETETLNQIWAIEKNDSVNFKVVSQSSGKCLTVKDSSLLANTEIIQSVYNSKGYQKWSITDCGFGLNKLTASHSNQCMEISLNSAIVQNPDNNLPTQRWIFEEDLIAQSATETFNYPLNSQLNNLGKAGNGWNGPWMVFEGVATDMSIVSGKAYSGLPVTGNRLAGNLSANAGTRAYRELNPAWQDDGDSIWFSFLLDVSNPTPQNNSWQGVSFFNGTSEQVFFGKNWGVDKLGIIASTVGGSVNSSTISYTAGQAWIVVLIKTSGDASNEQAYMWINPNPATEPNISTANVTQQIQINGGFDHIACHLGQTAGIKCYYDEIRLARTFNAIVPTSIRNNELSPKFGSISYPNPFNSQTTIKFNLDKKENVNLEIYDLLGKKIETLMKGIQPVGECKVVWTPKNLTDGVYLYKLQIGSSSETEKLVFKK